ncbi:major histocompatibility complex class I-related gene protein-like isoform X3 [Hemicordylus capensis]|uniref:major histocompatibility complex class I-related gene protein-like isoform X3 n=1 Tax=Hemicordylus capensis TaxID=884348 RepID=UPI00230231E8|nr:major histocompatibility complex class I-related gene protein-like isoform X3 [Hemicordylus capensis]
MGLLWWQLSVLGVAVLLLGQGTGSSTHSLGLSYTWLPELNQGLPEFMAGQFVDDQPITYYDSSTKRVLARAQWMEKNNTQFWDLESKTMKSWEEKFRALFVRLKNVSNQSEGLHTWQGMLGCGLREDGKKWGYWRSGYDGRDFISFNTETITWMVADAAAEKMKGKWGSLLTMSSNMKRYLEGPCIERLLTLVACGNGSLLRKERPVVKVTLKATVGGQETLFCQAYGFYPKGINITWRKDGEFWKQGKFSVNPNSDGTYHSRTNIQIDPKDRGRYLCSVEHASLPEPHLIPLEGPDATISVPTTTHRVKPPDPTVVHPSPKDAPRCPISQCISHASLCNGVWYCSSGGDEQTFGSSSHSLRFSYTGVSEPSQELPAFTAVEFVDDQPFVYYDSSNKRAQPRAQWMEKAVKDDAQLWDTASRSLQDWEEKFRMDLMNIQSDYSQSEGLHTWQYIGGCELSKDGKKKGYEIYGFDGWDFIFFDMDTLTWMSTDAVSQKTKRRWETDPKMNHDKKQYLDNCINWLQKSVAYGKESLLRKGDGERE